METKPKNFDQDMSLEIKFSRTIKAILGQQFIGKSIEADLKEGTDFLVFQVSPFRIAVRLRRYKYFLNPKYQHQFTVRWKRPSGVKTEIDKINDGLVDYMLYGFVNASETKIVKYFIADLSVFRNISPEPAEIHTNADKSSQLAAYQISQFPEEFILKKWEISPKQ